MLHCIFIFITLSYSPNNFTRVDILNTVDDPQMTSFDSLNMRYIGSWSTGPSNAVATDTVRDITFCASQCDIYTFDVSSPASPVKISEAIHCRGVVYDIIYITSSQLLYIACGLSGCEIWDVSDIYAPQKLSNCDTPGTAYGIFIGYPYAYIADGPSGFRILDITDPLSVNEVGSCNTSMAYNTRVQGNYAYVADYDSGMIVIDISDPANPNKISSYNSSIPNSFMIALEVSQNYVYVNECHWGQLIVLDISDPYNLEEISTLSWLCCWEITLRDTLLYTVGYPGMFIIDISDPYNLSVVGTCTTSYIGRDICLADTIAYCAADYDDLYGLRVMNIASITNPYEIGSYPTPGGRILSVCVVGNLAYLADDLYGLRIIDITIPSSPIELGNCSTPGHAHDVVVKDSLAYIASRSGGLRIINVSNPTNPYEIGNIYPCYDVYNLQVVGDYAYIAGWSRGLRIIDISTPTNPYEIGSYDSIGVKNLYVSGNYAYLIGGLHILDISDPTYPQMVGTYTVPHGGHDVYVVGSYAYVAAGSMGLHVVDVSDPYNPYGIGNCVPPSEAGGVHVIGDFAYVGNCWEGVSVVNISDPTDPYEVGYYTTEGCAWVVVGRGSFAYLSNFSHGFHIYEFLEEGIEEENIAGHNRFDNATIFSGPLLMSHGKQYRIFDITGRQIQTLNPAPGIYFIEVDGKITQKVIKIK